MPIQIIRLLILTLTVTWLLSCNQAEKSSALMQMEFGVERELLADVPVIDSILGISFFPPKHWLKTEIDSLHLPDDAFPEHHPVAKYFFMHPADSSSLLIAEMPDLSNEQLAMMSVNPNETFNSHGIWDDVQHATFAFNGFGADQFLLHNNEMINFKLILTADTPAFKGKKISLDFFLPRIHYEENIKSVESSIGSLVLFNQK